MRNEKKQKTWGLRQRGSDVSTNVLRIKLTGHNFQNKIAMSTILEPGSSKTFGTPPPKKLWGRCWANIGFRKTQANVVVKFEAARFRVLDRFDRQNQRLRHEI